MKRWYVIQVVTGTEERVKKDLEARIAESGLQDCFGRVVIPQGIGSGSDGNKEKIFPGYILVEMDMNGDTRKMVLDTDRVSKFLGGDNPIPLSEAEVEKIFEQIQGRIKVGGDSEKFLAGGEVHIVAGPFEGFTGIIEEVDEERERLKVMVSIFGRMTAVELGFDQVKR